VTKRSMSPGRLEALLRRLHRGHYHHHGAGMVLELKVPGPDGVAGLRCAAYPLSLSLLAFVDQVVMVTQ